MQHTRQAKFPIGTKYTVQRGKQGNNMEKTRTELVMQAIGWQGGTVHDLCQELGLDVVKFLNHEPEFKTSTDYILGTYINTNSMKYRKNVLIPKYKGNYDFWIGAAKSMELVNKDYCYNQK